MLGSADRDLRNVLGRPIGAVSKTSSPVGTGIGGRMTKSLYAAGLPAAASGDRIEVACFTQGSLIATPRGELPVERLQPGDRVFTRDNGSQDLLWVGRRSFDWPVLRANPHLQPVLIRRDALGPGMPSRDLYVSPNHRMLVIDGHGEELLVAAKELVGSPGVIAVEPMGITYLHLLFDAHEIVLSDGAWSESFQPSDFALGTFGNGTRNEILTLFPDLGQDQSVDRYRLARRLATVASLHAR